MNQKKAASSRPSTNDNKKLGRKGEEQDELTDYGNNESVDAGAGLGKAGKAFDKRQNRF